ncbi:MAG: AbrB family transcriptional regulator [Paracoccaceae bacterium]|nr:AbrB family transcriptional regulator [Paracoccaceae bacterium]
MSTSVTLLIGIFGACIAWIVSAPAPFLTGPATFVTIFALLFRINCHITLPVRNLSFVIIGISTAEGIDSQVLDNLLKWPISLTGMFLSIVTLVFLGKYIFQEVFKMRKNDAILASTPGHLSYVLSLSESHSENTVVISVIQSIRVLTLTLAVPGTISLFTDYEMRLIPSSNLILSYPHLIIIIALSALIGLILFYYKTPAAFLLGGMFCSTIGHGFDFTPGIVPEYLAVSAFIILGSLIGSRFTGISLKTLKSCIFTGSLFTALCLIISIISALIISNLTKFNFIEVLIAIAPGGLETMIVMGQLVGTDPAFVAFHHLARLFILLLLLSIMIKQK